jgi:hypothetical protein
LEAAVSGTTGTEARVLQRVPLAPGAEDEEDGIHKDGIHSQAIIDAWPVAPERMRLPRREQRLNALPQFVGYTPFTPTFPLVVMHG